jgi:glycosyltransferase involved in cell wall biosynthesis
VGVIRPLFPLLKRWDWSAAQNIDKFITMTDETSERIKHAYGRDSVIVPPPIDCVKFSKTKTPGNYFLVVSRLEPYKKVDLVIRAFNDLDLPLKIVGNGTLANQLKGIAGTNIEFYHSISDEELINMYKNSIAVIFPQKEDYGLVPLEANACGKPVICYGYGGVKTTMIPYSDAYRDVATAFFYYDQSIVALKHAIRQFLDVKFNQEALLMNARRFDIDSFKEKILNVILTQ